MFDNKLKSCNLVLHGAAGGLQVLFHESTAPPDGWVVLNYDGSSVWDWLN